jgi:hypothetical protein
MLNMYGIIRYYRCVDDILILVSSDEKLPACFAAFSALIKFFIPEIEEQSSEEVTMLKLVVYMRDGVVHTRTAFKPNSLGVPLDSTSAHHSHVHAAWPAATLRSALRLCSPARDTKLTSGKFINRFSWFSAPSSLISRLNDVVAREVNIFSLGRRTPHLKERSDKSISWVVLPYHPVWQLCKVYSSISRFMNGIESLLCHQHDGLRMPTFKIAYKNILKPAWLVIDRL